MLAQLPRHTVSIKADNYEHLDLLWGKDVDKVVFPHVLEALDRYAELNEKSEGASSSPLSYAQVVSGVSRMVDIENGESDTDGTTESESRN